MLTVVLGPTTWFPYSGWKQPAVRAASAHATASWANRLIFRLSRHDIDDPLRHHDHLLGRLALKRLFYRIERQNGSLNIGVLGLPGDGDVRPLLAVHLHRKRNSVLDQEVALDLWPILHRNQRFLAQRGPAFFGEVRHHR